MLKVYSVQMLTARFTSMGWKREFTCEQQPELSFGL